MQAQRHCPELAKEKWLLPDADLGEIDGEKIFKCPVAQVDRDMAYEAFRLANHFQKGFLPYAGGIYDQPERLMQMIETVEAVKAER